MDLHVTHDEHRNYKLQTQTYRDRLNPTWYFKIMLKLQINRGKYQYSCEVVKNISLCWSWRISRVCLSCHIICFSAKRIWTQAMHVSTSHCFHTVHHKSLQQVWPCSLFSKVPLGPSSTSNPTLLNPRNQLSSPAGAVANPTQKPTDLHRVLICLWYWSHHASYHKRNPTPAECVEESLWLCRRTADDWLWRPAVQKCAAFWRLRRSKATNKYSRLNMAVTLHVQTQLGSGRKCWPTKQRATKREDKNHLLSLLCLNQTNLRNISASFKVHSWLWKQ